ncbi:MAG: hypothetical protein FRX48_02337 [Lasallia pustulata]|uniref:Fungal N-terminal domain-containing protein n=1 Tax=Lasallia pustulata TaxID=136370 RepID=A0A5M8PWF7_9LECA|nr:MAG: hypothetical protein FRX48_02337 [Lasallia pustulata]
MRHFLARHHQGHFDSLASNSPFVYHNRPNNRGKVGLPYWAQHLKRPDEVDGSDFYRGGLAASLVTLLGLAANSCKTLHDLQQQLRSAPEDIQRLVSKVETFRELLQHSKEKAAICRPGKQIWTKKMQTDLQAFGVLVNKPDDTLTGLSITRKNIRARARKVLSEQAARKCEDAFGRYKGVLDSVQGILNSWQIRTTKVSLDEQARKIITYLTKSRHSDLTPEPGSIKSRAICLPWKSKHAVSWPTLVSYQSFPNNNAKGKQACIMILESSRLQLAGLGKRCVPYD